MIPLMQAISEKIRTVIVIQSEKYFLAWSHVNGYYWAKSARVAVEFETSKIARIIMRECAPPCPCGTFKVTLRAVLD